MAESCSEGRVTQAEIDSTAQRIMEASLVVFSEFGFHDATVRQIAERAGIAPATIYEYFPSKERVLQAIFERKTREAAAALREHLEGIECAFDKIRKHTWFSFWYFERNPDFAAVTYLALPFHSLLKYGPAYETACQQGRIFTDIVKEGQAAGEIRPDVDIRKLRDLYFGGVQRLTTVWLLSQRSYSLVGQARDYSDLIVRAIRIGPQGAA